MASETTKTQHLPKNSESGVSMRGLSRAADRFGKAFECCLDTGQWLVWGLRSQWRNTPPAHAASDAPLGFHVASRRFLPIRNSEEPDLLTDPNSTKIRLFEMLFAPEASGR